QRYLSPYQQAAQTTAASRSRCCESAAALQGFHQSKSEGFERGRKTREESRQHRDGEKIQENAPVRTETQLGFGSCWAHSLDKYRDTDGQIEAQRTGD